MRNIGDVNAELKAAVLKYFDVDGVIEVARGRGIDRDGVAVAEIVAPDEIRSRRVASGKLRRLPPRLLSETMSADRTFLMMTLRFDIRIIQKSDDADDFACGPVRRRWEIA